MNMLNKKVTHNRLKPKPSSKNKKTITTEDKDYLEWLQNSVFPCMVCGNIDHNDPIEWHHIKNNSTDKKNHKRLVPLCGKKCHRLGTELSAHSTPKLFRETYPIELQEKYADGIYRRYLEECEG